MKKAIFIFIFVLAVPTLAFSQWQSRPNHIVITPNPGDNSATYFSSTGETGQIRDYPGVTIMTPYPRNDVLETEVLLNNLHQSVQNLGKSDSLKSFRQKHFPGFIEDD